MHLQGKAAVITGGGRGIGAATARALAAGGAAVVVAARTAEQTEQVAAALTADGHRAWATRCDVADPVSIDALQQFAADRLGAVDILVNNAGVASAAPLHRTTLEEWERLWSINVTGTFLGTKAFMPGMVERGWGRVVNVASVAGLSGAKYIAAYAASKHAVVGFTRSVADEVAKKGVTVNAVCPGYVDTEMTEESIARIVEKAGKTREEALQAILAMTPQERLISPDEVAQAISYLCTDSAKGINGQTIVIDGGGVLA